MGLQCDYKNCIVAPPRAHHTFLSFSLPLLRSTVWSDRNILPPMYFFVTALVFCDWLLCTLYCHIGAEKESLVLNNLQVMPWTFYEVFSLSSIGGNGREAEES